MVPGKKGLIPFLSRVGYPISCLNPTARGGIWSILTIIWRLNVG
jgi:hypothetical protein